MGLRDVTGDEVKQACLDKEISWVDHHECSICDRMVGYIVEGEQLLFSPGCRCVLSFTPPEPRSWDEAADWINMQSDADCKRRIAARFGIEL